MQQFIPFEDDWDAFERFCSDKLVPYRVGLIREHGQPTFPEAAVTDCVRPSEWKPPD